MIFIPEHAEAFVGTTWRRRDSDDPAFVIYGMCWAGRFAKRPVLLVEHADERRSEVYFDELETHYDPYVDPDASDTKQKET